MIAKKTKKSSDQEKLVEFQAKTESSESSETQADLEHQSAAKKVQDAFRNYDRRKRAEKLEKQKQDLALRMQAIARGNQGRQEAAEQRARQNVALGLQAIARGNQGRQEAAEQRARQDVALGLQAVARGNQGRQEAAEQRARQNFALVLQAIARGNNPGDSQQPPSGGAGARQPPSGATGGVGTSTDGDENTGDDATAGCCFGGFLFRLLRSSRIK